MRTTGTPITTTTLGEKMLAFVPYPLQSANPPLAADSYIAGNHRAEMAVARLAGVADLVPSASHHPKQLCYLSEKRAIFRT